MTTLQTPQEEAPLLKPGLAPRTAVETLGGPFVPHPLLRNGHVQTLVAAWMIRRQASLPATTQHRLLLSDGDQLVLHDDGPTDWQPGDPVAVLLHGLCGSAASTYMSRIAFRLNERGHRTFRVDMRGCGTGHGLARRPYHAGRSDDLAEVIAYVGTLCPLSPLSAAGFSLGGNILLKYLGEQQGMSANSLTRAVAVNPPADLQLCTDHLSTIWGGLYDRHFARLLFQHVRETPHWHAEIPSEWTVRRPRRLIEFDERFTAPRAGFASAADYYHRCSAARVIEQIDVPTLVLSSRDDPLVPVSILEDLDWPASVRLLISHGGGHLGYISRAPGNDPDRNWMDWRVVNWLTADS